MGHPTRPVGSREPWEIPDMTIRPSKKRRGYCTWEFTEPRRYVILGLANQGKSMLNEILGYQHPKILDLYGSRDNENLAWCRKSCPVDDILLIHGDNTEVTASWDTLPISEVTMKDLDSYEIVTTCSSFFSDQTVRYRGIQPLMDQLFNRLAWRKGDIIYLVMRETMNVIYSRTSQGIGEKDAKADMLYFIREMRHFGVSIGADTLRWTGIDKELRDIADYTLFKNVGDKGLPGDKSFIYSFFQPSTFMHLRKNEYIFNKSNGDLAYGKFPALRWHKEEGVNLLPELGIKVKHHEILTDSDSQRVGDKEHEQIIRLYDDLGTQRAVQAQIKRSLSTISQHIKNHNEEIAKYGKCTVCFKAESDFASTEVQGRRNKRD